MLRHDLIGVARRILALPRRRRIARDIDDELRFHLAMREADLAARGGDDAAGEAHRRFGNVSAITEQTREMWTFPALDSVGQDIRYTLRGLRRAPGFALLTILMLALGIGANTAIFSLLDALIVRGLPYPEPGRLMVLIGTVQRQRVERRGASYPDFLDWRGRTRSFEDLAVFDSAAVTAQAGGDPERITLETVSASYFPLLRIAAAPGRTFTADEDSVPGRDAVAIIGDGLARRWFGGGESAVGRTIRIGPRPFTVIGVAPAGFAGATDSAQLWVPYLTGGSGFEARGNRGIMVLGRLRPAVTLDEARRELDGLSRQLEAEHPDTNAGRGVEVSPLTVETTGPLRPAVLLLMAAVGLVLLIACANVANLLMARSEARQREMAVRASLGAGRGRLLRQLATESLVLTGLGAVCGLGLAWLALRGLLAASPITLPSFARPGLDPVVLAFTTALAVLTGLLLGLAPAWHTRPGTLSSALTNAARGSGGVAARRLRGVLVAGEIALAVVLLSSAGLLIQSIRQITAVAPGFETAGVLTLRASIPRAAAPSGADPAAPQPPVVASEILLARLGAVPGVERVALASDIPLGGGSSAIFYSAEGAPIDDARVMPRAYVHRVSPDFFAALGMPIHSGRPFAPSDATREAAVVIVSEGVARRFWPGGDAVGRRLKPGRADSGAPWLTIVGVVPDVSYRGLPQNPTADPDLYFPYADTTAPSMILRTSLAPAALAPSVRAALRTLDAAIVLYDVSPLEDRVRSQSATSRFTTWIMSAFAAAALMLAAGGIYGVMSYVVARRTREFGIRLALGATRTGILGVVLGDGTRLVAAGVLAGGVGAALVARVLQRQLFGVGAFDPSMAGAVAILAALALAACVLPALRATRVDPVVALRAD